MKMEVDIKYELESVGISNISCDIEYQLGYRVGGDIKYQLGYRVGGDIEYQLLGDIGYQLEFRSCAGGSAYQ